MREKLSYFGALKYLSKYIVKYKSNFICFYIGWLLDTILAISMPILFGIMIDQIVYYQEVHTFIQISILFVVLSVFSCILYFFIYAQHHYLMSMYTFDIKIDMFDHFMKCDAAYMGNMAAGDTLVTIQNYAIECMHFVIRNLCHLVNVVLCAIAVAIYLLIIDWRIGIVAIAISPISAIVNKKIGKRVRDKGEEQRLVYGNYISWIFEMAAAFRDLRIVGLQKKAVKDFGNENVKVFNIETENGILKYVGDFFLKLFNLTIRLVIFFLAGYAAVKGNITVGLLTVVISFYEFLVSKVEYISSSYLDSQERIAYIQHIYDFMQIPVEKREGKSELKIVKGEIKFENVDFSYPNSSRILSNLNLKINPGEKLGLVGLSGSGKTTLAYMLVGFYRPNKGNISIDEQNIADVSLKTLRKEIGLVQQKAILFNGTIRENILLGKQDATEQEIVQSCIQAGIWEFINSLPNKLDTFVGKDGTGVSGGQRQRIAMARIYLKNPSIIIFDEATASLDAETEEVIHSEWKKVLDQRTAIIISHRKTSLMLCNRIAVLENGHIVEVGATNEMMINSLKFKTIFAMNEADISCIEE